MYNSDDPETKKKKNLQFNNLIISVIQLHYHGPSRTTRKMNIFLGVSNLLPHIISIHSSSKFRLFKTSLPPLLSLSYSHLHQWAHVTRLQHLSSCDKRKERREEESTLNPRKKGAMEKRDENFLTRCKINRCQEQLQLLQQELLSVLEMSLPWHEIHHWPNNHLVMPFWALLKQ